jgi:membrane dipeptidase
MTEDMKLADQEITAMQRTAIVIDTVNRSVIDDGFLRDIRAGGLTAVGRTILASKPDVFSPFGFSETLRGIVEILESIDAHPDDLMLVKSAQDIQLAKSSGRVGLYIYFQNPEPIDRQLWRLRLFFELGLRVLQLTYNERSLAGDGCGELTDAGLSDFGRLLIKHCNSLGIAIDVSHCGNKTTLEAIEASSDPVLITHGMARALCDNPRCKTDEAVKACASKGGVVGVQAMGPFISTKPNPTLDDLLDHVDYYVQLVGPDSVGLGLDLVTGHERDDFSLLTYKPTIYQGLWQGGVLQRIPGIETLAEVPNITRGLLRRGYAEADVSKILGGNFMRAFGSIWHGEPR